MNKRLKQLTWKYFIQNKIKEIVWTIIILGAIIFIPYLLGSLIGDNEDKLCGKDIEIVRECVGFDLWFEGALYIIGGVLVLFIVGFILFNWIKLNWEKSEKQAKKELKLKQRKDVK